MAQVFFERGSGLLLAAKMAAETSASEVVQCMMATFNEEWVVDGKKIELKSGGKMKTINGLCLEVR